MMDDGQRKFWRCPRGHALGLVVADGRMLLFRQAVEQSAPLEEVDVIAVVVGRVVDVRCSICGRVRTWVELRP